MLVIIGGIGYVVRMTSTPSSLKLMAMLAFSAALWGVPLVFIKQSLLLVNPVLFLFLRFSTAAFFLIILFRKQWRHFNQTTIRHGSALGIMLFLIFWTQTVGLQYTSATNSAFITSLYMVFTPVLSALVFRRFPSINSVLGVAVATVGCYLLTSGQLGGFNKGDLWTLVCAACCGMHIILIGRYAAADHVIILTTIQVVIVSLLSGIWSFMSGPIVIPFSEPLLITVGLTALFSTVMAFSIQMYVQRYLDPIRTALVLALEPVFSMAASVVFGGEPVTFYILLGASLILSGVVVAEIRPYQLIRFLVRYVRA